MKTKHSNLLPLLLAVVLTLTLSNCAPDGKRAKEADIAKPTKEETVKSLTQYPIPTAFQITQMLNKAGASYILSLNNPVENVDKYFTEKSKALNLGVYGANLAYASTYQMTQETMSYLRVTRQLIDELQISTAFNAKLAEKIEENLDNKDVLIDIISDSLYETYEFLNNHGKDNLSLLVMAGGWIEGMYITCQISIISKDNKEFLAIVASQKEPLGKLIELLEPSALEDEAVAEVLNKLMPLNDVYQKIEDGKITDAQFEQINDIITEIRTSIV